ncbi:MAG: hypothetical protein ACJ718_09940 [Nitrososphaeraceae archaeon]
MVLFECFSQDMSVPFDLMILRDIFQQNLITSDKLHVVWDDPRGKVVLAV